jgi:phosphotransferase system enzyme I (PtsI)
MAKADAPRELTGISAGPGVAAGPAFVFRPDILPTAAGRTTPELQVERLRAARTAAAAQTRRLRERAATLASENEAGVFDAQLLIIEDPDLAGRTAELLAAGLTAEDATATAIGDFARRLEALTDPYFVQRATDVRDVGRRLQFFLSGRRPPTLGALPWGCILLAQDLSPSEVVQLDPDCVAGIATVVGSPASHTAVFARAMGLPAVVGVGSELLNIRDGESIVLLAGAGRIVIDPDPETMRRALQAQADRLSLRQRERTWRLGQRVGAAGAGREETRTRDGRRVEVAANAGGPAEALAAAAEGAEGIGLLRSELLYLTGEAAPSEEEQYLAYRQAAEVLRPYPVIVRTVDLGGDKPVPYLPLGGEANPFMGFRGLRICLERRDLFRTQLRAILRASLHGNLEIMFPMVIGVDEVRQARGALEEAMASLEAEGMSFDRRIRVGLMIETPAAVMLAGDLAPLVDFFSLGTNDLTQYVLAVDRANAQVAHLYQPENPAVLRTIDMAVSAALAHGRWVGVCGEMASDLSLIPLLVGLGVNELSVAVPLVAEVRDRVQEIDYTRSAELARRALKCVTPGEVRRLLVEAGVSSPRSAPGGV